MGNFELDPSYKDVPARIADFKAKTVVTVDGCWEWQGKRAVRRGGYAVIYHEGKERRGHRLIYTLAVGPIPTGLTIDHLCSNTACINPVHLEPVTFSENRRRASARRTTCKRGHSLADAYITTRGHRDCRTCRLGARYGV